MKSLDIVSLKTARVQIFMQWSEPFAGCSALNRQDPCGVEGNQWPMSFG